MSNVTPFGRRGGHGGHGPDDPDLSGRVARLEEGQHRIEATLARMEKVLDRVDDTQRKHGEGLSEIKGQVGAVEGRIQGIEGRFAFLPTSMQLIGFAVAVFLAAGVLRFFEPRLTGYTPPAAIAPR